MFTTHTLIDQLSTNPQSVSFQDVMALIDDEYSFTPTAFKNGSQQNQAGENNGSCKILSFAQLNNLPQELTLHLFGDFYRLDVLNNPEGNDHQNIRQFILNGWEGVSFASSALVKK
ncbi:type III effector [Marinomonas piezotolerans]|uniref:Type III effector n=1 Tax=Marinomonas piezotolerans TaxID=2213058 RepID=A0A370U5T0_9GAMM|nr:HopJ type III effector protein [Marinomonas piezotolerans]RDL43137.1 type III effector [Marinomonas piezotolerans]